MAKSKKGQVTFLAQQSPKQMFSIGNVTYRFIDGEFTTDDSAIIAFLRGNPACSERKAEPEAEPDAGTGDEGKKENGDEGQPN